MLNRPGESAQASKCVQGSQTPSTQAAWAPLEAEWAQQAPVSVAIGGVEAELRGTSEPPGSLLFRMWIPGCHPIRDSVGLGCRPESSFLATQKWFFGSTLGTSTLLRAFFVVVNSGFSVQQRERDFVSSHHCPSSSNCTFSPLNGTNCQTPCPFPHRQAAGLAAQLSFHVWLPCVSLGSVVSSLAKTKPQRMVTG